MSHHTAKPRPRPAGTNRLSRLLHSVRWAAAALTKFLWRTADQQM